MLLSTDLLVNIIIKGGFKVNIWWCRKIPHFGSMYCKFWHLLDVSVFQKYHRCSGCRTVMLCFIVLYAFIFVEWHYLRVLTCYFTMKILVIYQIKSKLWWEFSYSIVSRKPVWRICDIKNFQLGENLYT